MLRLTRCFRSKALNASLSALLSRLIRAFVESDRPTSLLSRFRSAAIFKFSTTELATTWLGRSPASSRRLISRSLWTDSLEKIALPSAAYCAGGVSFPICRSKWRRRHRYRIQLPPPPDQPKTVQRMQRLTGQLETTCIAMNSGMSRTTPSDSELIKIEIERTQFPRDTSLAKLAREGFRNSRFAKAHPALIPIGLA